MTRGPDKNEGKVPVEVQACERTGILRAWSGLVGSAALEGGICREADLLQVFQTADMRKALVECFCDLNVFN